MQINKRKLLKKILKSVGILVSSVILIIIIFFSLVYFGAFGKLPNKKELKAINNEEASLVISSDSVIIGKYFAENRTNIKWKEVPLHLKNALIATEDKRFFSHKGFDVRSYFRVFFRTLLLGDKSGGGGSTITQQLVKNLYGRGNYGILSTPVNKIREIILAYRLEEVYSKEDLLLLYFNSVPFGEDVYGVESASQRYFNKPASKLKIEESAVLVGGLKAKSYFNPRLNPENSLSRRNLILELMHKENYLTAIQADSLRKIPLILNYENLNLNAPAGYFVYQVKKKVNEILDSINKQTNKPYNLEKDGLRIYTTLNMQIQDFCSTSVKNHLTHMQGILNKDLENSNQKKHWYEIQKGNSSNYSSDTLKRKVELFDWEGIQTRNINKYDSLWHYYKMLNAAVLVTNPKNGAVLTWIGGNSFRILPFDMVLSHRQIASAFKPVLFATALEMGISPCIYLENKIQEYPGYEGWVPQNANLETTPDSTVALWYALANSMNLPSIDLYFKVGIENLSNSCKLLEFQEIPGDAPSIAIGTLDLSLFEIIRAYGALANQGQMNDLYMIDKITDARGKELYKSKSKETAKVFNTETSNTITAILQQAINQGTGTKIRNQFGIKADLAGKTGSAQNYSDAWFIAYTPDIVMGTWVGASTPDLHFYNSNGSGSSLALPIIGGAIREIEKNQELKRKYLTPFGFPVEVYSFLDCNPFHQLGMKGFFNRLFVRKDRSEKEIQDSIRNEKKKQEDKSFFKKLFKKDN